MFRGAILGAFLGMGAVITLGVLTQPPTNKLAITIHDIDEAHPVHAEVDLGEARCHFSVQGDELGDVVEQVHKKLEGCRAAAKRTTQDKGV